MEIRHIYYFANHNLSGISVRYRSVYVLNFLFEFHGISNTIVYPGYKAVEILNFFKVYFEILFFRKNNSLIIFQKLYTKGIYTSLLKLLLKLRPSMTVYDIDDADYLRFDKKNIVFFMKNTKICIVGSKALFNYVKEINKNVLVLTTPIIHHQHIKTNRNSVIHIGWVGDYGFNKGSQALFSHKMSLEQLFLPALNELNFPFKLTLLGIKTEEHKKEIEQFFKGNTYIDLNIPNDINWQDEDSVYKRIKAFDIGVSPMINSEFNKAKSAFKIKQYLSCGVPVLGSPVGENLSFIKDGKNGFLCKNKIEFKEKIEMIKNMNNDEYQMFMNNTQVALKIFSVQKYCNDLLIGLKKVAQNQNKQIN